MDCHGDKKCCTAGCATSCVPPAEDITVAPPVDHGHEDHQPRPPTLRPVPQEEVDVDVHEGGMATLRCFAAGYPPPTIQWKRGGLIVNFTSEYLVYELIFNVKMSVNFRLIQIVDAMWSTLMVIYKSFKFIKPIVECMFVSPIMVSVHLLNVKSS